MINYHLLATSEFENEKVNFETAKVEFFEAFRNIHTNTEFRRCKKVTECSVSKALLQIENATTTHHSKGFEAPDLSIVIAPLGVPEKIIDFKYAQINCIQSSLYG